MHENFFLWGPHSELEAYICVLQRMLKRKKDLSVKEIMKFRRTRYSNTSNLYSEENTRIIMQLNKLDDDLYKWGLQQWMVFREAFPMCFS